MELLSILDRPWEGCGLFEETNHNPSQSFGEMERPTRIPLTSLTAVTKTAKPGPNESCCITLHLLLDETNLGCPSVLTEPSREMAELLRLLPSSCLWLGWGLPHCENEKLTGVGGIWILDQRLLNERSNMFKQLNMLKESPRRFQRHVPRVVWACCASLTRSNLNISKSGTWHPSTSWSPPLSGPAQHLSISVHLCWLKRMTSPRYDELQRTLERCCCFSALGSDCTCPYHLFPRKVQKNGCHRLLETWPWGINVTTVLPRFLATLNSTFQLHWQILDSEGTVHHSMQERSLQSAFGVFPLTNFGHFQQGMFVKQAKQWKNDKIWQASTRSVCDPIHPKGPDLAGIYLLPSALSFSGPSQQIWIWMDLAPFFENKLTFISTSNSSNSNLLFPYDMFAPRSTCMACMLILFHRKISQSSENSTGLIRPRSPGKLEPNALLYQGTFKYDSHNGHNATWKSSKQLSLHIEGEIECSGPVAMIFLRQLKKSAYGSL